MFAELFSSWHSLSLLLLGVIILILNAIRSTTSSRYSRLPPGPRSIPLVGSLLDIPTLYPEQWYRSMNAKYGDIVHFNMPGQHVVVLGTHETAVDLLEKKSSVTSDRVSTTMVMLSGWGWMLTTMGYSSSWRRHRKVFYQHFNTRAARSYRPVQERHAHHFIKNVLKNPREFAQHIRRFFAASILEITYGMSMEALDTDDGYVNLAEAAVASFGAVAIPGKYWVDMFPLLRFVPSWVPGAGFKRKAHAWKALNHNLRDLPWEWTKASHGSRSPSVAASLMQDASHTEGKVDAAEEELVAKNAAAAAYAGGSDTTLSAVQTFFLAMGSYPDVQRKAQVELDAVVGHDRLPTFADHDSLPYVSALVKECLRWRVVAPLGMPHASTEVFEFRGYVIPRGTLLVYNIWGYSRDPRHYPDPEVFRPERFLKDGVLDPDVLDPSAFVFGYGRRKCPGRHLAEAALFISVATALHTLSVTAPNGADGKPVRLEGKMTSGFITYPEPFELDIVSRGPWAENLIANCTTETTSSDRD
ncbi:CyP450 monooxygenase [Cubamyces lactineus]|nr:CyP450 monooxygenase [Cubamyces lactineus]